LLDLNLVRRDQVYFTELRKGERALLYYKKALLNDSSYVSPYLKSRIYAQIGIIYLRNKLYEDAIEMEQLANFYCQQDNDTLGMKLCNEAISNIQNIIDSQEKDDSTTAKMATLKIMKLNEQVKSDILHNTNTRLQAENDKRKFIIYSTIIIAILLLFVAILIITHIHRQMVARKKLYEDMGMLYASKRMFFDNQIETIIKTRLKENNTLKEKDWEQIEEKLLQAFPSFKDRIFSSYPFSDFEYHLCILIKMEISPSNMATLLATSKSNITQSRLRMQQKVFNGRGTAKNWDSYVLAL